ncbi:MMPL family transporter [Rheinheimera sp. YQF-2]|uniref:MMPL family transporter n=1 Tax=Rheinheimera lutimaris TaxID=2740584 RepID=A0A7Y5APF2_9GAMM|nr:MMPL family transporter [Rheinheimera lutimaris]NRQ41645.1 MMPL family transporter [Rheinheimera lutimaris]
MTSPGLHRCLRHPWWALFFSLLLIALCSIGMGKLYFRGDYRIFFSPQNPQLLAFEQMQYDFNKSDNLLIAVVPQDGNVFTADTLTLLQQLTEAAWLTPYAIRVDSVTNYQHTEADNDDLLVADLLYDPASLTPDSIARIKQIALQEPALVNRLVSASGAVAAINITVQLPEKDQNKEVQDVWQYMRQQTDDFATRYPGVEFHLTGVIAMNHAFASEAENDAKNLVPLMLLGILVMLAWLLRSVTASFATLVIIIVSVTSALGLAGWAGIFLSTATINVPTILMTLAVADSVHIIASAQFALRRGDTKLNALHYSISRNLKPVLITSITTAIGFLTLNFSEVPILRDLGNMTAAGVMLACLYSLVLLPVLLLLLPLKAGKATADTHGAMDWLADTVIRYQRLLLPGLSIFILLCTALISLNKVNDEAIKYFAESTEFRQSNDFLEQNLSGFTLMDFSVNAGQSNAVNQPEFLAAVDDFSQWLLAQPEVTHVNTVTDVIKRLNKNMHGDNQAFYRLPDSSEQAAQFLLMYEMSLPFGLDLNNQLNIDKSATRISATLRNLGSKELTGLEARALQYMAEQYPHYKVTAASAALMFAHIGERNMASMLKTLPLALVLISLLLIFSLQSWRLGLLSMVPNIAPALVGFGLWGLISGEINLALSVVAGMSLGIIVDDTVHFLSKYQHARQEGRDAEAAVRYAFHSVGRALWITTLVLVAGFGVLMFSGFRLNSDMGMLTALIIFIALLIDFLLLPACLLRFDNPREKHHV